LTENHPILQHIQSIPLFSGLNEAQVTYLAQTALLQTVAKGETIFKRGDPAHGFYYLLTGAVKLSALSAEGNEKVIEIIQPGMTFGEAVMFIGVAFPVFAQTLKPVRMLYVPKESVMRLLNQCPDFSLRMLAGLSRRMHGLVQELEAHCLQNASQRVIGYLLRAVDAE